MIIARYDDGNLIGVLNTDSFRTAALILQHAGHLSTNYTVRIVGGNHAVVEGMLFDILLERVL